MPEKKLYCKATNCAHNRDEYCRAGYINVRGNSALKTSETTCSTYFADSVGFFTSAIEIGGYTTPENIVCEACNCIYYDDTRCTANSVLINSHFSSCETFKCE
ncbi:DUF1540 domain-containing protein [Terrisporobacter vanillatitrophus]|uniref:DUF1540 domain-containing protein n=1 Tax=Terrisporobacter vanillatitrophus TaxID=3058402 RepID=UPI003366D3DD